MNHRVMSSSNGLIMTYDANGNTETKSNGDVTWKYGYDGEDQLIEVKKNDQVVNRFGYDDFGNRLRKVDAEGRTTLYVGSNYEIAQAPLGVELHTKYIGGPAGRVVSISISGPLASAWTRANTHNLSARMADPLTVRGLARYVKHRTAWAIVHPQAGRYVLAVTTCVLIIGLLAVSTVGVVRGSTQYVRRRPRFAYALPVVLVAFVLFDTWAVVRVHADLTPGENGAGVPVAGTFYFHQNQVSSSTMITSSSGMTVARIEYEPFGKVYQPGSNGQDMFRPKYGGQELDRDSGLYYFKARYYDPDLGRFLTPDQSVGSHPLHNSALNRYAYVGNNPITYTDPSGKYSEVGFFVGMLLAAGAGFLIGGTDGKILSDPSHAFDNWSWEGAFIGGYTGLTFGALSFGLGTIGTGGTGGATLGMMVKEHMVDVPLGPYLQKAFNSAFIGTVQSHFNGMRDSNRLGAYFGTSFLGGVISSTGFFMMGERGGFGGGIAEQMSGSVSQSLLKQITNPGEPLRLSLWGFTVTFGKDFDLHPNSAFLIGQGASFLNDTVASGWKGVKQGWSWNTLTEKPTGGAAKIITAIFPRADMPKTPVKSVYSVVDSLAKGMLQYAVPALEDYIGEDLQQSIDRTAQYGMQELFGLLGPAKESKDPKSKTAQDVFFEK